MSTPTVSPVAGPVLTSGARVVGQMYYIPDDLFVICASLVSLTGRATVAIDHPMIGRVTVPTDTLREVRYV